VEDELFFCSDCKASSDFFMREEAPAARMIKEGLRPFMIEFYNDFKTMYDDILDRF
jgi:hypothetical protein